MNFSVVLDLTIECHGDIQKRTQYIKQNRITFSGFGVVGFFTCQKVWNVHTQLYITLSMPVVIVLRKLFLIDCCPQN